MSYYPNSPQNTTGLGYASTDSKDASKMSGVKVVVTERHGAAPESFTLTQAQEDFAQKIASTGKWEEMPHSSGRRQIRQRVLDILTEKIKSSGSAVSAATPAAATKKTKPKSETAFVLTRTTTQGTEVVAVPRLKSQAKEIAALEARKADPQSDDIAWVNDKENAVGTVEVSGHNFVYTITRKTLLKPTV